MVIAPVLQPVGQALHGGHFLFGVMGILVPFAVAQLSHQPGGSVPDLEGHRFVEMLPGIVPGLVVGQFMALDLGAMER